MTTSRTDINKMTVFDYLNKCGGKEVLHFTESVEMKDNIEDAYQYAQDLRSALFHAHSDSSPMVKHSGNRVIISSQYEVVTE